MDQQAAAAAVVALSAIGFALANALQHRAAGGVPRGESSAIRVLLHLARDPWWLIATGVSSVAMLLHATALHLGSIAFVQPLMLVGVVLAVPIRAALERKLPGSRELAAVGITVAGLATFLSYVSVAPQQSAPRVDAAIVMTAVGLLLAAAAPAAGRRWCRGRDRLHASLLGATAGCLFGVTAGLLKLIGSGLGGHKVFVVALVSLAGVGILGTAINQRAYQLAPLAFSMPMVNVVDVLVALVFGAYVFGEVPGSSPGGMVVQVLALGAIGVGLREIARLAPCAEAPFLPGELRAAGAVR